MCTLRQFMPQARICCVRIKREKTKGVGKQLWMYVGVNKNNRAGWVLLIMHVKACSLWQLKEPALSRRCFTYGEIISSCGERAEIHLNTSVGGGDIQITEEARRRVTKTVELSRQRKENCWVNSQRKDTARSVSFPLQHHQFASLCPFLIHKHLSVALPCTSDLRQLHQCVHSFPCDGRSCETG